MSYIDDLQKTQSISKEMVEYLRELKEQKVSTGKIKAIVVEKLREEWANQIAYHENKLVEHDIELKKQGSEIKNQGSFLSKLLRGLNGIVK